MSENAVVTLPIRLLFAYGALAGLSRAAMTTIGDAVLADAIQAQLDEIERLWDNRAKRP